MIASNISAAQFIGMSGNSFQVGVAVAAYEWVAAIILIIVAVFFIPIDLKQKIYTVPQFLEQRYNAALSLIMRIFWLFLYVLANLTGPRVNPRAISIELGMFKVSPQTLTFIVLTLLMITALYVKFW